MAPPSEKFKHSYCVMLKSICTVLINDSSGVFARWRHSAMKFLNKKVNDCVQRINIAEVHQFSCNSVMEFSEYYGRLLWKRVYEFLECLPKSEGAPSHITNSGGKFPLYLVTYASDWSRSSVPEAACVLNIACVWAMGITNRRDNGIAAERPLATVAVTDETTIAR